MNLNNEQQVEDIFKEKLGNFSPEPRAMNWDKITHQMEGETLDDFAKNSFENFEQTPNPKIWNNIKKELPLSLWLRSHLHGLSKIAAILMVFMVVLLLVGKQEAPKKVTVVATNNVEITPAEKIIPEASIDFVFAIEEAPSKKRISASEELSLEDEKTIEDFWSLMDDEEDFITDVNESIIKESLKPILQLPIENLQAALPKQKDFEGKKTLLLLPKNSNSTKKNTPGSKNKIDQ